MDARNAGIMLIVDDNAAHRNLIDNAIKGCDVCPKMFFASNASEAKQRLEEIEKAEQRKPDLILLDRKLPGQSGPEFIMELKNNPETETVPVVVMTASESPLDIEEIYRAGANSCLEKPMDFMKLSETMKLTAKYWMKYNRKPV